MITDEFSNEKECSVVKENEKIGLLTANDYHLASLDSNCVTLKSRECANRNYLADSSYFNTWLLSTASENTYKAYSISKTISEMYASTSKKINPTIYLSQKVVVLDGKGKESLPYIIKN